LGQASGVEQVGQDAASLGLEAKPEGKVEKNAGDEEGEEKKSET